MELATERLSTLTLDQLRDARSLIAVRYLRYLEQDGGHEYSAFDRFAEHHKRDFALLGKTVQNPGTTSEPGYAAPLVQLKPAFTAIVELARAAMILGRLPGVRRVPFATAGVGQTGGTAYGWAGENQPKLVGSMSYVAASLAVAKAIGIVIVSRELLRAGTPGAERVVRNDLVRGLAEYLDRQLMDPTVTAVAGVNPASILAAAPSIGSAGTSAANALTDIKLLLKTFYTANADAENAVWIMSPANAAAASVALGVANLDRLFNLPVVTSSSAGARVAIVDAGALLLADEDELRISISNQSTVELSTTPTSPPTAGSVLVSLYQNNLSGIRAERLINWKLARANAAVYTNAAWV